MSEATMGILTQKTRCSLTLSDDKDLLKVYKDQMFQEFKKESGEYPALYFFTFGDDDYERGIVTLVCLSERPKYILVTVPQQEIETAVQILAKLNIHLKLKYNMSGYNADDFMYNRITARFTIL